MIPGYPARIGALRPIARTPGQLLTRVKFHEIGIGDFLPKSAHCLRQSCQPASASVHDTKTAEMIVTKRCTGSLSILSEQEFSCGGVESVEVIMTSNSPAPLPTACQPHLQANRTNRYGVWADESLLNRVHSSKSLMVSGIRLLVHVSNVPTAIYTSLP